MMSTPPEHESCSTTRSDEPETVAAQPEEVSAAGGGAARLAVQLLVLLSLVGLVVALWTADFLHVPQVVSVPDLLLSFALLLLGMLLAGSATWQRTLRAGGYRVSMRECVASMGLSVYGKYLPGKIWSIAGRAAYVARRSGRSMSRISVLSLKAQLLTIWTGLTLGTIGLVAVRGLHLWGVLTGITWLILSLLTFLRLPKAVPRFVPQSLARRWKTIAETTNMNAMSLVPWFAASATLRGVGFFFLVRAFTSTGAPWSVCLALPFASAFGMIAVFAPGGLGVREGILAGYLMHAGFATAEATTLSVVARLWFFLGETVMFILGLAIHAALGRGKLLTDGDL
jgi:hypothetical protein